MKNAIRKYFVILLLLFFYSTINAQNQESYRLVKTVVTPHQTKLFKPIKVTLIGKNDYVPADESDLSRSIFGFTKTELMEEELKAIVKRTVQISIEGGKSFGTGFLIGNNNSCDRVITARHVTHHYKIGSNRGKVIGSGKNNTILNQGIEYPLSLGNQPKDYGGKWKIKDEVSVLEILKSQVENITCPVTPILTRQEIKENLNNCRIIGFPSIAADNNNGSRSNYSGVPPLGQKNRYAFGKRGIASCEILGNHDGLIAHNCDSLSGASGGPIVCKVGNPGIWSYVAVNNGGKCSVDGKLSAACFLDIEGPPLKYDPLPGEYDKNNAVFGRAGSFTILNKPLQYSTEFISHGFNSLPKKDRIAIQKRLKVGAFYKSTIDGLWGRRTLSAIEKFARYNNHVELLETQKGSIRLLFEIIY